MEKYQGQILIADDNPANLRLYSEIFEAQGYECVLAENGRQTLRAALSYVPDLMILSIDLPKLDGFEVAELIKEETSIRHIPLIAVTKSIDQGSDKFQDMHQAIFDAGFQNYLIKPFKEAELLQMVETHILRGSSTHPSITQKQKA